MKEGGWGWKSGKIRIYAITWGLGGEGRGESWGEGKRTEKESSKKKLKWVKLKQNKISYDVLRFFFDEINERGKK